MKGTIKIGITNYELENLNFIINSASRLLNELDFNFTSYINNELNFTCNNSNDDDCISTITIEICDDDIVLSFEHLFNLDTLYKIIRIFSEETSVYVDFDEDSYEEVALDEDEEDDEYENEDEYEYEED